MCRHGCLRQCILIGAERERAISDIMSIKLRRRIPIPKGTVYVVLYCALLISPNTSNLMCLLQQKLSNCTQMLFCDNTAKTFQLSVRQALLYHSTSCHFVERMYV